MLVRREQAFAEFAVKDKGDVDTAMGTTSDRFEVGRKFANGLTARLERCVGLNCSKVNACSQKILIRDEEPFILVGRCLKHAQNFSRGSA